jgi:peptidoglycan hydrolase CwlO-like protein
LDSKVEDLGSKVQLLLPQVQPLDSQIEDVNPNVQDLDAKVQVVNPRLQPANAQILHFANKMRVFGKNCAVTIPHV